MTPQLLVRKFELGHTFNLDVQIFWISEKIPAHPGRRMMTWTNDIFSYDPCRMPEALYPRILISRYLAPVKADRIDSGQITCIRGLWRTGMSVRSSVSSLRHLYCRFRECEKCQNSGAVKSDQNEFEQITEFGGFWPTAMLVGRSESNLKHLYRRIQPIQDYQILDKVTPASWKVVKDSTAWYWKSHFGSKYTTNFNYLQMSNVGKVSRSDIHIGRNWIIYLERFQKLSNSWTSADPWNSERLQKV